MAQDELTKPVIDINKLLDVAEEGMAEARVAEKMGDLNNADNMLRQSYKLCKEGGRYDGWDALDQLLDFMGFELGLYVRPLDAGPEPEIWAQLRRIVKFEALANFEDNLGKLVTMEELTWKDAGQFLTPGNLAEMMVSMMLDTKHMKPYQTVLDPCVGFGVFLIKAMEKVPPGVILCGIDIDWRAVHATMIQLRVLQKYAGKENDFYILRDDALAPTRFTDPNFSYRSIPQSHDWSQANKW